MDDDLFFGISKHRKSVKSTFSLVPLNVFPYMTGGTGKPLPAACGPFGELPLCFWWARSQMCTRSMAQFLIGSADCRWAFALKMKKSAHIADGQVGERSDYFLNSLVDFCVDSVNTCLSRDADTLCVPVGLTFLSALLLLLSCLL